MKIYDIAIVGGGPSAVCVLGALVDSRKTFGSIVLFNCSKAWWTGRPFQSESSEIRLNSHTLDMNICESLQPFSEWLIERGIYEEFPPRKVYGEYLTYCAKIAIETLRNRGWKIDQMKCKINSCVKESRETLLLKDEAQNISARAKSVILSIGVGPPHDRFGLSGKQNYINDPYPINEKLKNIPPESDVGIIGAGLTSIDVAVALHAQHHRGKIQMVSRSGILPAVRQNRNQMVPKEFSKEWFKNARNKQTSVSRNKLLHLLKKELRLHGASIDNIIDEIKQCSDEEPKYRIKRQLDNLTSSELSLRVMQYVIPAAGPEMWTSISPNDQHYLRSHFERKFLSLCCPIPPENAKIIWQLMNNDQLKITAGEFDVNIKKKNFLFTINGKERFHVNYVINATPPRHDKIPPDSTQLIKQMIEDKLLKMNDFGGISVDPLNSRCVNTFEENVPSKIYAIGDITSGTFYFTFGIISIVDRAKDIVEHIIST